MRQIQTMDILSGLFQTFLKLCVTICFNQTIYYIHISSVLEIGVTPAVYNAFLLKYRETVLITKRYTYWLGSSETRADSCRPSRNPVSLTVGPKRAWNLANVRRIGFWWEHPLVASIRTKSERSSGKIAGCGRARVREFLVLLRVSPPTCDRPKEFRIYILINVSLIILLRCKIKSYPKCLL